MPIREPQILPDEAEAPPERRRAPRYRVLLHDDDRTPMDFVVTVLGKVFQLPRLEAWRVMYEAHGSGVAQVEVVPLETAEWHVQRAHGQARAAGYPLTFTIEAA